MSALAILMLLCGQTISLVTAYSADSNQRLVRKMIVSASGEIAEASEPSNKDDEMMRSSALSMLDEVEEIARSGAAPESDKIKVIKDIVTGELLPDLKATRKAAVDQVGVNIESIKTCNANMLSRSQDISSTTEVTVGQKRTTHAQCREEEKGKNSTKGSRCQELDDFLNAVTVPAKMPDPKQRDAMVEYVKTMSQYFCPKGPTATDLDKKCTEATNAHSSHKADCDKKQATFENAFCTWRTQLSDRCSAQSQCYTATLAVFNEHVAATKTLVKKWKVEYAALKKILCYTDVWLNDNNAKTVDANQLKTCESSTIDTSPMDIKFPDAPAKATCSLAAVQNHPGRAGFVTTEYANFNAYVVTVIPCLGTNPTIAPTKPSVPVPEGCDAFGHAQCPDLTNHKGWHASTALDLAGVTKLCYPKYTMTQGGTCKQVCEAAGFVCLRAQDNVGNECSLDNRHHRQTQAEKGCLQKWHNQICQCGKKA